MSDLQCPARFVVVDSLDEPTVAWLRHHRVAAVYDGRGAGASGPPEVLGLTARPLARELRVEDVLARRPDAVLVLGDLADQHRGETVVVLALGTPGQRLDVTLDADALTISPVGAS